MKSLWDWSLKDSFSLIYRYYTPTILPISPAPKSTWFEFNKNMQGKRKMIYKRICIYHIILKNPIWCILFYSVFRSKTLHDSDKKNSIFKTQNDLLLLKQDLLIKFFICHRFFTLIQIFKTFHDIHKTIDNFLVL